MFYWGGIIWGRIVWSARSEWLQGKINQNAKTRDASVLRKVKFCGMVRLATLQVNLTGENRAVFLFFREFWSLRFVGNLTGQPYR